MKKFVEAGIAGRALQLRYITIPAYIGQDGKRHDRQVFCVSGIDQNKNGNLLLRGHVAKGNSFPPRSVRVDRIRKADVIVGRRRKSCYILSASQVMTGRFKEI